MKSPSSSWPFIKKDRCLDSRKLFPLLLSCLGLTTIFSLLLLYSPNPLDFTPMASLNENCDLFTGSWIPELNGIRYTNSSCGTIPESKNCFRNGRQDIDFLNWRWKPDKCNLPRFNGRAFLEIVRGQTMGFVGDSVARNHMESLLCHLSQEEVPIDTYKDAEDRNRIWHFPSYNFTLKILWTKFLVSGEERTINGSSSGIFDLNLDKVDKNWARNLSNLDYIIISNGHWFFRPIHLYKSSKVIACVYCNEPNITDRGVSFAVQMAFRVALSHINSCKNCQVKATLVRTFSPSHFENGFWNTGGSCNRTTPFGKNEIDFASREGELRNMQVKEIIRANKVSRGKKFEALDVTRAMLMRPDGHPGAFWGNKWMKGYNDCVHWCLPGPIDLWNDMLLAVLRKLI